MYPVELIWRDRPDFLLKENGIHIGIEHTEAVPQNEAHKSALREKGEGPDVYFIARHQPGEPTKSSKKLIEEIRSDNPGPGWSGDSVETEWSEAMDHCVGRKLEAFGKGGFEKFERNWLLIYDNWSLPFPDFEKASKLLLSKIRKSNCFDSYEKVYIITGNLIYEFSKTEIAQYTKSNLW